MCAYVGPLSRVDRGRPVTDVNHAEYVLPCVCGVQANRGQGVFSEIGR